MNAQINTITGMTANNENCKNKRTEVKLVIILVIFEENFVIIDAIKRKTNY